MIQRFFQLFYYWGEYIIETYLVPKDRPGWFFGLWFKHPLLYYKLGLGPLIGKQVLVLTTIGRKTGKARQTPLGYGYDAATSTYHVVAGWDGRTDWYRNLKANPKAHVQVGKLHFDCAAEFVPIEGCMEMLRAADRVNPLARRIWRRWTGVPFDGTEAGLRLAAAHFPAVALKVPGSRSP